jgi:predicted RNase H-like nuclease (RuvC/YqgF family)
MSSQESAIKAKWEQEQRSNSEMAFALASSKAELDSAQEVNRSLRGRIEVLAADLETLRSQLRASTQEARGQSILSDQVNGLQSEVIKAKGKVRSLEECIEQLKVLHYLSYLFSMYYHCYSSTVLVKYLNSRVY